MPESRESEPLRRHLRLARLGLERADGASRPGSAPDGSLEAAANPLLALLADLLRAARRDQAKVLLIVDQFEELLDRPPAHSANAFLRLLRACTQQQPNGRLVVVGTMRSDFLGVFQQCPPLAGVRYESLSVGPMRNLTPVIVGPARTAGVELESGLVESLVADAKTGDALPLLAFSLRELYDRAGERSRLVTLRDYDDLGRLEGAVAKSAGQLVAPLSEDQQGHLRHALLALARITDEGNFARRTARWSELAPPFTRFSRSSLRPGCSSPRPEEANAFSKLLTKRSSNPGTH